MLVFIAVLGNYLYSRFIRSHTEVKDPQILDSEMLQSVESFEYSDSRDGMLRFKIRALRLVEESPGKVYLQDIEAFDFNPGGSVRNEILSRYAEYDRINRTVDFIEDVRLSFGRDIELRTRTLHYDMNADIGTTRDPVEFHSENINGKAVGLHYRLDKKSLELKSEVDFSIAMEKTFQDGSISVEIIKALSDKAFCFENGSRIVFQDNARLRSDSFFLEGDSIRAVVDEVLKEITSLSCIGNASYRADGPDENRILSGDRMVFNVHAGSMNLENIKIRGNAVFDSVSSSEERRLQGAEMDLVFDPERDTLQRINGRIGIQLRMKKRGAEETNISGERFNAVFNSDTGGLKDISVLGQGCISMADAAVAAGNRIRAERIDLKFRERSGQVILEKLRAQGSAQWTIRQEPQYGTDSASSYGMLSAAVIEMFYTGEGRFLNRVDTSGNVVMTELSAVSEKNLHTRGISADRARFGFYPDNNKPRDMVAEGSVQVDYEGETTSGHPGKPIKFQTASDNMSAVFAPDASGIVLASASQWGNFKYRDESWSAVSGRCDYDARNKKMILSDTPKINFESGYATGDSAAFYLEQETMRVRNNVRSILSGMSGPGLPGESSVGSGTVITADNMQVRIRDGRTRYTGNVRLLSEEQLLQAENLEILDTGESVEATGGVRHRIYRDRFLMTGEKDMGDSSVPAAKNNGNYSRLPINIESSSFKYVKAENAFTYSGNTYLVSSDLELRSGTLETVLDESGNGIEQAIAKDGVVVLKGKWKCAGDVAIYYRVPERIVVEGEPAECVDPEGWKPSAPRLTYNLADDRIQLEERGD